MMRWVTLALARFAAAALPALQAQEDRRCAETDTDPEVA